MVVIKFGKFKVVFKWIREYLSVGRTAEAKRSAREKYHLSFRKMRVWWDRVLHTHTTPSLIALPQCR